MTDLPAHSGAGQQNHDGLVRPRVASMPRVLTFASLGLMELDPLAARIADHVYSLLGNDLVNVTLLDKDELVVRATAGNCTDEMEGMRCPSRTGLGGLTVMQRRSVIVSDYAEVDWPLPLAATDVIRPRIGEKEAAA